jgi:GLPGLI family protein
MKNIFLIILVFVSGYFYAQEKFTGLVHYKQTNNLDFKVELYFDLYFNNNKSLFIEKNPTKIETKKTRESIEDGYIDNVMVERKNIEPMFFFNEGSKFIFMENMHDECLYVADSNIILDWKLNEGIKKIGAFECKEATVFFRGRNYIAWYAPDIPVKWGPHKFSGLNGLILEISDENNIFNFVAEKVVVNQTGSEFQITLPKLPKKILTPAEFKRKEIDLIKTYFQFLSSQQPKGTEPIVFDENCEDCRGQQMELEPKK